MHDHQGPTVVAPSVTSEVEPLSAGDVYAQHALTAPSYTRSAVIDPSADRAAVLKEFCDGNGIPEENQTELIDYFENTCFFSGHFVEDNEENKTGPHHLLKALSAATEGLSGSDNKIYELKAAMRREEKAALTGAVLDTYTPMMGGDLSASQQLKDRLGAHADKMLDSPAYAMLAVNILDCVEHKRGAVTPVQNKNDLKVLLDDTLLSEKTLDQVKGFGVESAEQQRALSAMAQMAFASADKHEPLHANALAYQLKRILPEERHQHIDDFAKDFSKPTRPLQEGMAPPSSMMSAAAPEASVSMPPAVFAAANKKRGRDADDNDLPPPVLKRKKGEGDLPPSVFADKKDASSQDKADKDQTMLRPSGMTAIQFAFFLLHGYHGTAEAVNDLMQGINGAFPFVAEAFGAAFGFIKITNLVSAECVANLLTIVTPPDAVDKQGRNVRQQIAQNFSNFENDVNNKAREAVNTQITPQLGNEARRRGAQKTS